MAKTKTPFLSLGSHGSLAGSITSQKRGSATLIRKKPIPSYTRTLPQQYQRWLYQDYAYLWTQQSQATQRQYAAKASRYHLTGMQYWMTYHLANLPDILAWWKLDITTLPTTPDASKNNNPGAVFGASPAAGPINNAFYFDGLNDYINFGNKDAFHNLTAVTIEAFLNLTPFTGGWRSIADGSYWGALFGWQIFLHWNFNLIMTWLRNTLGAASAPQVSYTPNTWFHYALTWDGSFNNIYINGTRLSGPNAFTGLLACTARPLILAKIVEYGYNQFYADNFIIYNRALDQTEILRHSLRGYPS